MSVAHPDHRDEMRQRARWMNPPDDAILECLRDMGNMTPKAVSRDGMVERVDIGRKYAGKRLRDLEAHGFVEYVDDGLFRLTDRGRAYLDEEYDAEEAALPNDYDD
jgi:Mn-dependent DtxR family transcriptional regulator